ncbi:hypothetical protein [Nostoc sp.]|uniref:hypothetical protein n=1 Tax=Nostoc sp. TaxID=1180 RepID=UPI002FFB412F
MKRIQLILNCAIAVFAFSSTLSGSLLVFGQKKPNYFNITIPASAARLVFGLGMLGTGLTVLLASRIEAVETGDLLKPKPIHFPCSCCRYYHGSSYGGVTLNCAIHPEGYEGNQCPDWQAFNHLNK